MLPEISIAPRTVSNYAAMLKPNFKKELDAYLKNRAPVAFLSEVRGHLQIENGESQGNRYNIQSINALVMYVGTSAIQYLRTKGMISKNFVYIYRVLFTYFKLFANIVGFV